jgi:2-hydroxychromene-2-carboxylate isomerase
MRFCDYFFACVSPWTYLGHERFLRMAQAHQVEVRLKPMNLAEIFPLSGGLPLARRAPQRQAYRLVELERWRAATGVELHLHPKHFPADDRLAARCVLAAQEIAGLPAAQKLTGAFLRMVWAEDRDIASKSSLREVIEAQKLPSDQILIEADSPAVIAQYLANTQEAVEAQVFGAPWYVFEGIPYWGQDRLDFLERAFAGTLPRAGPN